MHRAISLLKWGLNLCKLSRPALISVVRDFVDDVDVGENGRATNLLKGGSKRKRTRAELEEVKKEEEELKNDKQTFL